MSSQEDINADSSPDSPSGNPKDVFEPKQQPKIIRVLTVLAYVLSVSMAAILLSIYYIFMWEGHPHIGARIAPNMALSNKSTKDEIPRITKYSRLTQQKELPVEYIRNITEYKINITSLEDLDMEHVKNNQSKELYLKTPSNRNNTIDMQQQITAYEEEPNGESTTALPTITTTEEENTTWQDYGNDFEQIRKRSIFIKKIMNFKHSYDDIQ